jgi:hypothetical protein
MNQVNGIFLELDRWLIDTPRTGILQIGGFSGDFFKKFQDCKFKNINYVDDTDINKFSDKSKIFSNLTTHNDINVYNVLFINSSNVYEIISSGIPANFTTLIIRYNKKKLDVSQDILFQFCDFLKFGQKYIAEHKGKNKNLVDLIFIKQK